MKTKLKALIIENEFTIPKELKGFIKDNKQLFGTVMEEVACLHRPLEDIARFIIKADAILASSTWMYKDQLEMFVEAFVTQKFGKPYKFYLHPGFCDQLNKWNKKTNTGQYEYYCYFDNCAKFVASIKKLVQEQEVYDIKPDYEAGETKKDEFHQGILDNGLKEKRFPYKAVRIAYDEKKDLFYYVKP